VAEPEDAELEAHLAVGRFEKAQEDDFDLIILDVRMPRMDGYEACRILRQMERTRNTPVIMLSALSRKTFFHSQKVLDEYQGEKIPEPEAYIEKPPEPDELLEAIERCLG